MNTPSTANVLASSQPSRRVPQNLLENEDLTWERFKKVVTDQDVVTCYDMSLKGFEHFGVHDLFKVCINFLSRPVSNIYMCILSNKIFTCVGNVQVHRCIQAGNGDGQDKDLVGDEDPGS